MNINKEIKKSINSPIVQLFLSMIFLFSILVLAKPVLSLDVDFWDTYTGQGSSAYDRIVWVDTFSPTYFITLGVLSPANTPIVYCVNEDRLIDSTYEFCIAKNSASKTLCDSVTPIISVVDTSSSSLWYNADVVDTYMDIGSGGNSFYEPTKIKKRGQIQYFINNGGTCQSAGSTANSASYDYYFIDETFNVCDSDRSKDYEIRGYYDGSNHVLVDGETCATNLVCDSDHDGQTSTSPNTKPSHPCKIDLDAPLGCSDSSECWNDNVCDGAHFEYGSLCDNDLIDIVVDEYDDNCGGDGVLVTVDTSDQNNDCNIDGGYPVGYVCDETLDDIFYDTLQEAYDGVCRGGVGNSCTINSDCVNYLDCNNGFCGYSMVSIYTDNSTDNKLNKFDSISFDNSLSSSSDDDIQFSCWKIDGVNTECDGDSAQCTSECSGASYDSVNWDDGFINSFNSGGNFEVTLFSGSDGLYEDNYSESFCVSGDGNYCFTCNDGVQNDDEINIDWGGRCGFPYFIKCNNGLLDNVTNETLIDYGGACGNCDNTSVSSDEKLIFLKQSKLITYPFSDEQCGTVDEVQGGIVTFVLILSLLLVIPILFVILLLIVLVVVAGTGAFSLGVSVARRDGERLINNISNIFRRKKEEKSEK